MLSRERKLNLLGQFMIFLATIAWGTSFFILKETIEQVPAFYVIAIRFIVAGSLIGLIFFKTIRKMNKKAFLQGFVLGVILTFAYMIQTLGLKYTTPGRNAFLTSSYCVMCPFLMWIFFRKKPKAYNIVSAVMCVVGIGLVALSRDDASGENVFLGDGLTLISAVFYGLQLIYIDKFRKDGADIKQMLSIELLTVGVLHVIASLIFELPTYGVQGFALNVEQILKIGYLTLTCTLFAQFAQMFGQRFTSANQSAIILSLEAVFGVIFSVIFAGEKLTLWLIVGFVVIFTAIMVSELQIQPLKLIKQKTDKQKGEKENEN